MKTISAESSLRWLNCMAKIQTALDVIKPDFYAPEWQQVLDAKMALASLRAGLLLVVVADVQAENVPAPMEAIAP